jgi:hypothetical protein
VTGEIALIAKVHRLHFLDLLIQIIPMHGVEVCQVSSS